MTRRRRACAAVAGAVAVVAAAARAAPEHPDTKRERPAEHDVTAHQPTGDDQDEGQNEPEQPHDDGT